MYLFIYFVLKIRSSTPNSERYTYFNPNPNLCKQSNLQWGQMGISSSAVTCRFFPLFSFFSPFLSPGFDSLTVVSLSISLIFAFLNYSYCFPPPPPPPTSHLISFLPPHLPFHSGGWLHLPSTLLRCRTRQWLIFPMISNKIELYSCTYYCTSLLNCKYNIPAVLAYRVITKTPRCHAVFVLHL